MQPPKPRYRKLSNDLLRRTSERGVWAPLDSAPYFNDWSVRLDGASPEDLQSVREAMLADTRLEPFEREMLIKWPPDAPDFQPSREWLKKAKRQSRPPLQASGVAALVVVVPVLLILLGVLAVIYGSFAALLGLSFWNGFGVWGVVAVGVVGLAVGLALRP